MKRVLICLACLILLIGCSKNNLEPKSFQNEQKNSHKSTNETINKNIKSGYKSLAGTMVLTDDGELWMWGENYFGKLGDGTWEESRIPKKIMDNVKMVDLNLCSIAVKDNGELWTWGCNSAGQLGDGTTENKNIPQKIMDNVKIAKTDGATTFALKENGELWAWGYNEAGSLGDGTNKNDSIPKKIMGNVKVISIMGTAYAIKDNGELWAWGVNNDEVGCGKIGNGTQSESINTPTKIMNNVKKVIDWGYGSYLIKENGELWAWGSNDFGEVGDGTIKSSNIPKKVMDNVKEADCINTIGMAIKENGELWIWGGRKLDDSAPIITKPIKFLENVKMLADDNGNEASVIKENGEWWACSVSNSSSIVPKKIMDNIKLVAPYGKVTFAVTGDNKLVYWDNKTLKPVEIKLGEQKEIKY